MPESLRTTIVQFSCSNGRWQPRAANVRAVEPASDLPSADRGSLYMLIELHGGNRQPMLYRQMLNAAQTAFYEMGDTVEAALRQAVRNAHAVLRQANTAASGAPLQAGISLVVRYGPHLIIGQAGPSLVLVSHPKTIDQFPAEPGASGPALGGDARPEVHFYDAMVEAGSTVLLAQSDWPDQVSSQALAVAAAASDVSLASQYLGQLAGNAELSALLIGFSPEVLTVKEEPVRRPAAPAAAEPEAGGKSILASAAQKLGLGRPAEEHVKPAHAAAEGAAAAAWAEPVTEPAPPIMEPSAAGDDFADFYPAEPVETYAPAQRQPAADRAAPARGRKLNPFAGHSPWPLLVALVVIPLLIAALVLAMLFVRNRTAEAEFKSALDGASAIIAEAETLQDETMAAQRLTGAGDFLAKARAMRPDDERLTDVEKRYQTVLDRVQHVTPLYGIVPLWDFKEANHLLDRVLVSGDSVFVLDRGRNVVQRFTRSQLGDSVTPADKPAIAQGEQVGNAAVGDLLDIAWAEASGVSQRSRLLALESTGGLVGYDVTWGSERLTLGSQEKWVRPQLIMGYGGNLYVVDVEGDQIWRYRPAAEGYESTPEPYFPEGTQVDLAGLQAMAIDGNIWLLFADGRLLKYFGGEARSFLVQGVPDGLSAPTAVAVPLDSEQLYIADVGNARIVELTKEGKFVRQFRPREGQLLRDVRSMFLDEANARFYILTADGLYAADVPAAAAAATPGN